MTYLDGITIELSMCRGKPGLPRVHSQASRDLYVRGRSSSLKHTGRITRSRAERAWRSAIGYGLPYSNSMWCRTTEEVRGARR